MDDLYPRPFCTLCLLSPFACSAFIHADSVVRIVMEAQYSSCLVTCQKCSHQWTYMGNRLASLARSRRPVKVHCPKCKVYVRLDAKNAK